MNGGKQIIFLEEQSGHGAEINEILARSATHVDVIVTYNISEALDCIYSRGTFSGRRSGPLILVLLGMSVRTLNRLEVLREIQSDSGLRNLPTAVLATSHDEELASKSYAMGANSYLVMPAEYSQFVDMVNGLVNFWVNPNKRSWNGIDASAYPRVAGKADVDPPRPPRTPPLAPWENRSRPEEVL